MVEYIQVFTTASSRDEAQRIVTTAVERRLAACGQVMGSISSTYWWQGQMETAEEYLCLFKTTRNLYEELERTIREIHSYDVPEILAVPVLAGNPAYLEWIAREVRS
jgi:periplasmic divalent cation tolerance protein